MRPTVLIVDDHEAFRTSARALLEADGFHVVGESGDGEEALKAIADLRPQVLLLDIQLPDMDGFAVATLLAGTADPPPWCWSRVVRPQPTGLAFATRPRAVHREGGALALR